MRSVRLLAGGVRPGSRLTMALGVMAALVGAAVLPGCGAEPAPPPPAVADSSRLDPEVARLIADSLEATKASPDDATARARLAMIYDANALNGLAIATYEQAVAMDDSKALWWYHLARARENHGDRDGAMEAIERAITLAPDYAPAHWRRGQWLLDARRLEEAEACLQRDLQATPRDAFGWICLARVHLAQGDAELAIQSLDKVPDDDPNFPHARTLAARALRALGRVDEAEAELRRHRGARAVWKDTWENDLWQYRVGYKDIVELSQQLLAAGRVKDTIALLEPRRDRWRNEIALLTTLGSAYIQTGELKPALETLHAADLAAPDTFAVQINLAYAYLRIGDHDRATAYADRAIELNPNSPAAHLQKAGVLMQEQRFGAAMDSIERALRLAPQSGEALIARGQAQLALARWTDAAESFHCAIATSGESVAGCVGLAVAEAEQGRMNAAVEWLRRAIALAPDDPNVMRARQHLEMLLRSRSGQPRTTSSVNPGGGQP